jgi:integrase
METMNDLFQEYMQRHSRRFKRSWKDDFYNIRRYLEPALGQRKINDVRRADIEILHGSIPSHFVANKCVALLSKMYNLAISWEYAEKNPATNVQKHPEKSREVYIPKGDAESFFFTLMKQKEPYRSIFIFLICTGCRKSEALKLKWRNVNSVFKTATFEFTKNGTDHTIPLHDKAIEVVMNQPKVSEYVFTYKGNPLKDLRRPWKKVLDDYGHGHYMIKDMRKSLASWMAQNNVSLYIIGGVLNHKDPRATMVYSKFQVEHLRTPIHDALNDLDLNEDCH